MASDIRARLFESNPPMISTKVIRAFSRMERSILDDGSVC
jgi:hypothetical protein